jgi:hypothetical protein
MSGEKKELVATVELSSDGNLIVSLSDGMPHEIKLSIGAAMLTYLEHYGVPPEEVIEHLNKVSFIGGWRAPRPVVIYGGGDG